MLKKGREAWLEQLHRAAIGTDWRTVERGNWTRLLDARKESLLSTAAPWTEIGSTNLAGRTHQSYFDAASNVLYVGASLGGVWRGTFDPSAPDPNAMNWTPISDNVYGGARGLVVFPGSPSTILKTQVGFFSGEVHRSTDGGVTWSVPAMFTAQVKRILRLAGTTATAFVLTRDCCSPQSQLYRSTNSGASFQLIRAFPGYDADIWTSRTAAGPLYLLASNTLEVSSDQGTTWSIRGTLPMPTAARATLTGSEAGAPRLYAIAMTSNESTRRIFRSDDAGFVWSDKGVVTDFWGDHTTLSASVRDANLVLYGGLECWRSTDGADTFQRLNRWWEYYDLPASRLHADIPSIDFAPRAGNKETLFISTDGGTYYSNDGGATVANLSLRGLRVSQYYSTLSDAKAPTLMEGGSQDQGFQAGDAGTGQFTQVISGDYGHLTSSDGSHDLVFAAYPGFVLAVKKVGSSYSAYMQDFPPGEEHYWMPPVVADPSIGNVAYLGARQIYRYELTADFWTVTPLPFNFQSQTGEVISAIAISATDPNQWYAATSIGRIFYSSNAGVNWTLSTFTSVPAPLYLTGLAISIKPEDPGTVVVAGSGYSNPAAFISTDGGVSFSPLGAGQPQTLVLDISWGPPPAFDLYAATENGPWRFHSQTNAWESLLQSPAPMTTYWSVEQAVNQMRFGTYGRGAWDFEACASVTPDVPSLTLSAPGGSARLDWTPVSPSTGYDVVRGDAELLGSSGGDFTVSTTACLVNDHPSLTLPDPANPPAGATFWYLVRPVNCAEAGTYDSDGQFAPRDAQVNASVSACR